MPKIESARSMNFSQRHDDRHNVSAKRPREQSIRPILSPLIQISPEPLPPCYVGHVQLTHSRNTQLKTYILIHLSHVKSNE